VATGEAQVCPRLRLQTGQTLLTVRPQPAIERAARELVEPAIRQLDRLAG
jgi:hypothetical protein